MELIHGFKATYPFYDDLNFPHGFSKSGYFSIPESEMLEALGRRLFSLEHGLAEAENQVEANFVAFCKSGLEPTTRVERVWHKYKKHTIRKSTITLGSIPTNVVNSDSYSEYSAM